MNQGIHELREIKRRENNVLKGQQSQMFYELRDPVPEGATSQKSKKAREPRVEGDLS